MLCQIYFDFFFKVSSINSLVCVFLSSVYQFLLFQLLQHMCNMRMSKLTDRKENLGRQEKI